MSQAKPLEHQRSSRYSAARLNVILLGTLAATVIIAPVVFLRGFGITDPSVAELGIVRVFALFAAVLGCLVWSARHWLASPDGRAAARLLAFAYGGGAILLTLQQWAVWYGRSGVAITFACMVLAIEYWRVQAANSLASERAA